MLPPRFAPALFVLVVLAPLATASCLATEGFYCPVLNNGFEDCPLGTYSGPNATSCTLCPPGSFSNSTGASQCQQCGPGQYADSYGLTRCLDCPRGKYFGGNNASTCLLCLPGTTSTPGAITCTNCSAGTYALTAGATQCAQCERGQFSNSSGMSRCRDCDYGSYQPEDGKSWCIPCGPGTRAATTGNTQCEKCEPGSYSNGTGASICYSCLSGTAQNASGQTSCYGCEYPSFAYGYAARECMMCPEGQVRDPIAAECFSRRGCTRCVDANTLPLCKGGFEGLGCNVCPKDSYPDGDQCRKCGPTWLAVIVLAAVFALVLLAAFAYSFKPTLTIGIRSFLLFLQSAALVYSLRVSWPDYFASATEFFSLTGFDFGFLSFSCYLDLGTNPLPDYNKYLYSYLETRNSFYSIIVRLGITAGIVFFLAALLALLALASKQHKNSLLRATAFLLTLSYISFVRYGMSMWSCDGSFMHWDTLQECDGTRFKGTQFAGASALVLIGLGLPVAILSGAVRQILAALPVSAQADASSVADASPFGLNALYQRDAWVAEAALLLRILVTVIGFQLAISPYVQSAIAIFSSVLYAVYISYSRPFASAPTSILCVSVDWAHTAELIASWGLVVLFGISFAAQSSIGSIQFAADLVSKAYSDAASADALSAVLIAWTGFVAVLLAALTVLATLAAKPKAAPVPSSSQSNYF